MATQIMMGHEVRILEEGGWWLKVRTSDGYECWLERDAVVSRNKQELDYWNNSPRVIVTAFEGIISSEPAPNALPISDVVIGDLLQTHGETNGWYSVSLPDGRNGFVPKPVAQEYSEWKRTREPTPENIERTARQFIGRPYLWGGTSPRGLDCSGLAHLVFLLNGIELNRNASQQATDGTPIDIAERPGSLRKGDLLFFGPSPRVGVSPRITHVGIYLGENLFIQSSVRVQISSLDPKSPIADVRSLHRLLAARRILPD
jgi:cell wall-associated NlpC family hydrolase